MISFYFVWFQEALDGIEFARGDANSTWGSVRAAMGHPKPFDLKYVAVGNEDCWQKYTYYKGFFFNLVYLMKINERCSYTKLDRQFYFCSGNYLVFYNAIKKAYPDIKIISNCDGSSQLLDHPADYYDVHVKNIHKQTFMIANQTVFMHLLFLVSGL